MNVEIFTVLKNAEYILPLYLKHYQKNFPECKINIYNNNSTDSSLVLCKDAGCIIKNFPVYTEYNLQDFKNNIWKQSQAEWIIICDVDELVQISQYGLNTLNVDVNIIKFRGYNMTGEGNPEGFDYGFLCSPYDKCCVFKNTIQEINYSIGAHLCTPSPNPIYSDKEFKLFHYNQSWFSFDNFSKKYDKKLYENLKVVYNQALKNLIKVK